MSGLALWAGVAAAGGVGSLARVHLTALAARALRGAAHRGTLVVNLVATLVAGVLVGALPAGDARTVAAVGLLGSLSTLSTWMVEADAMAARGHRRRALVYLIATAALGLAAAAAGYAAGAAW
ncbi:MAG: CrcB family protein [Miltoncostaeaceae bacterium]